MMMTFLRRCHRSREHALDMFVRSRQRYVALARIGLLSGMVSKPYRRIYPGFLQYPSLILWQPERQFCLLFDYLQRLGSDDTQAACEAERSIAHYGAMLDMPAEFILDTVRVVFQQTLLPKGMWRVAGRLVRPGQLRKIGLLTIEGSRDTISGVGHTHAAQDLCTGVPSERQRRINIAGCDHYGLFSGPNWRTEVYPAVHDWLVG